MMEWYWIYMTIGFSSFTLSVLSSALTISGSVASRIATLLIFVTLWPAFMVLYVGDFIDYWRKSKKKKR